MSEEFKVGDTVVITKRCNKCFLIAYKNGTFEKNHLGRKGKIKAIYPEDLLSILVEYCNNTLNPLPYWHESKCLDHFYIGFDSKNIVDYVFGNNST